MKKSHAKGYANDPFVAGRANPRNAKNTKQEKRLAARRKDYETTVGHKDFKAPMGAYHRPGSLQ